VPKLWEHTIDAHRRAVGDAILAATAELVGRDGLRAVTMAQVADRAGIGRATLYKYFPDLDAILVAWHERQLQGHLEQLAALSRGQGSAGERLESVLCFYASVQHAHRGTEGAALLHGGAHVVRGQRHVEEKVRDLLAEGAAAGVVRADVDPGELASYCLHALAAAGTLPGEAAVQRLVQVTLSGLRPAP
jgi:AcrR family transcriptional regulator